MQPKRFITPVWILSIVIILRALGLLYSIITILRFSHSDGGLRSFPLIFFITSGMELIVFIGQAITYWAIRNKKGKKKFAWAHMAIVGAWLFIMPVITRLIRSVLDRFMESSTSVYTKFQIVYGATSLLIFLSGLLFFMLYVLSTRHQYQLTEEQSANDILSDL